LTFSIPLSHDADRVTFHLAARLPGVGCSEDEFYKLAPSMKIIDASLLVSTSAASTRIQMDLYSRCKGP